MTPPTLFQFSMGLSTVFVIAAIVFAFWRFLKGPSVIDRIVSLDLLALVSIGTLSLTAVVNRQPVLLDIALAIAIITFLGTIALAFSIEKDRSK